MACARCDFYTPKDSTQTQLPEAKNNLQRILTTIPLTDEERAAVEDEQSALDELLTRLGGVPTPAGATPQQIVSQRIVTHLPIADIRHGETG